jgi:nitrogen-specific signal transduction histidine kinase
VTQAVPISPTRVLLVEDELTDALVVQRSLRHGNRSRERFALKHAATLAQGIEQLSRSPVDVLLVDLCLPDSEGPATVARLREQDRRVPLVVFTGDDDPRLVARAFEAGADEYLVKCDLHTALLRRTIRHAIERRRAVPTPDPQSQAPEPRDGHRGLLHDLKNLQTSILGNARLLQREIREEGFVAERVEALLGAARTAADLLRQIADSEESDEAVRPLELSEFVRGAEPLLRAVLPERVELRLDLAPDLAPVSIFPDAMRRVVLELVVNAVEAIGEAKGRVEIRTGHSLLAEGEIPGLIAPEAIAPGPHTWLEVRDDGCGFNGDTRARLFERGFSTKGSGRGHGLDLVQEILARQRAGLLVQSRPRSGSAFRILLSAV